MPAPVADQEVAARLVAQAIAADTADALDPREYSPYRRAQVLRLQKLFEAEARAHRDGRALKRGELVPLEYLAKYDAAGRLLNASAMLAEMRNRQVDAQGGAWQTPTAPFDLAGEPIFQRYRQIAWRRHLATRLEGTTQAWLNAEVAAHSEAAARHERAGPGLDGAQIAGDDYARHIAEATAGTIGQAEPSDLARPAGEFADYFDAQGGFRELCNRETGRIIGAEVSAERWAKFALAVEQTERLAHACETAGEPVLFADTPEDATKTGRPFRPAVWIVPAGEPDKALKMPNVRRIQFFPTVASARRSQMIKALRFLLERELFARMMTFTSGPRFRDEARLTRLNFGTKAFRERLGRVMKSRTFRRYARPLFVGTEFGTPTPNPEDMAWYLHIHAHCLFVPTTQKDGRPWSKLRWRRFLDWTRLALGAETFGRDLAPRSAEFIGPRLPRLRLADCRALMEENDRIAHPDEVCKYPVKPADLDALIDQAGPWAVACMARQVRRLRLAECLGELRDLRREVKTQGERFCSEKSPDGDGAIVTRRKNWNAGRPDTEGNRERASRKGKYKRACGPKAQARLDKRLLRAVSRLAWSVERETASYRSIVELAARKLHRGEDNARWLAVLGAGNAGLRAAFAQKVRLWRDYPLAMDRAGFAPQDPTPAAFIGPRRPAPEIPPDVAEALAEQFAFTPWAPNEATPENTRQVDADAKVKRPLRNYVMARCAPAIYGKSRVTQPAFCVIGWDGKLESILRDEKARACVAQVFARIDQALASVERMDAAPPLTNWKFTLSTLFHAPEPAALPDWHEPNDEADQEAAKLALEAFG